VQSAKAEIFFSCSFAEADRKVNEFFLAICRALRLIPTNVSTASSLSPPDVAKRKIQEAQALVAVCTRRDELTAGGYNMPQAVHDEISFAYGADTPVLMIVEDGVELAGFKSNFGTYLSFKRKELSSPAFVEKAVEAIHDLHLQLSENVEVAAVHGMTEAYAEFIRHLIELRFTGSDFLWQYSTSKKLVYTHASKRSIPSSYWTNVVCDIPPDTPDLAWELRLDDSTRGINLEHTIERQTPQCVEAIIKISPPPEAGDFVEYSTFTASRYLNPVWDDEAPAARPVHLNNGDYVCIDGMVFLHRTKRALLEFRFPRESLLGRGDLVPFVGIYTSAIDYEVESELKRVALDVEDFGGNVTMRMEIDSPLLGHMYGIAWNPKARPVSEDQEDEVAE